MSNLLVLEYFKSVFFKKCHFTIKKPEILSETHETWFSWTWIVLAKNIYILKLNKIFALYLELVLTYKCSKVIIRCLEVEILIRKVDDL